MCTWSSETAEKGKLWPCWWHWTTVCGRKHWKCVTHLAAFEMRHADCKTTVWQFCVAVSSNRIFCDTLKAAKMSEGLYHCGQCINVRKHIRLLTISFNYRLFSDFPSFSCLFILHCVPSSLPLVLVCCFQPVYSILWDYSMLGCSKDMHSTQRIPLYSRRR